MSVRTTVNVHIILLEEMFTASVHCNVSCNYLALCLLKMIDKAHRKWNPEKFIKFASRVKYQDRESDKSKWKTLHIRFPAGSYEYSIDLRKICKMSVSFLLAEAIRKYLRKLIRILIGNHGDSYPCSNYVLSCEMVGDVVCWKLYWGIPERLVDG